MIDEEQIQMEIAAAEWFLNPLTLTSYDPNAPPKPKPDVFHEWVTEVIPTKPA